MNNEYFIYAGTIKDNLYIDRSEGFEVAEDAFLVD